MNQHVYNTAVAIGILLASTGIGLWSLAAGVAAAGTLILAFTVYAVERLGRGGR